MILLNDLKFRLNYYWLTYIYLQLEKLKHHQNTQRILYKRSIDESYRLLLAIELIQKSNYSNTYHINEDLIIPISTFIKTEDSYFHKKKLYLNSIIQKFGLPTLFIILLITESK